MQQYEYTIKDPIGLHARPASLLAKATKNLKCNVIIKSSTGKTANAKSTLSVMSLGAESGETITVIADGENEQDAMAILRTFLKENL